MKVTAEHEAWPEAHMRQREWLAPETAAKRVNERKLRDLICLAAQTLIIEDRALKLSGRLKEAQSGGALTGPGQTAS